MRHYRRELSLGEDRDMKILWVSVVSVFDRERGATIRFHQMLEALAARGIKVQAICSTLHEGHQNHVKWYQQNEFEEHFIHTGVEYELVFKRDEQSFDDFECDFFTRYEEMLLDFEPDVVIGSGNSFLFSACFAEAQAKRIPTACTVSNGEQFDYGFPATDLIFTTSQSAANLYAAVLGREVKAVGNFIDPRLCTAEKREPRFITMINPLPEKGEVIFREMPRIMPKYEFLLVNAREEIKQFYSKYANVSFMPYQTDMRRVYEVTKVLVVPSLWFEAWGRVASEAILNEIPVIASSSGGLPEAVTGEQYGKEGAGFIVDLEDRVPYEAELEIARMIKSAAENPRQFKAAFKKVNSRNSITHSVDRLLELLVPLAEKGKREKQILNSWHFNSRRLLNKLAAESLTLKK